MEKRRFKPFLIRNSTSKKISAFIIVVFVFTVLFTPLNQIEYAQSKSYQAVQSDNPHFDLMMKSEHFRVYFHPPDETMADRIINVCEEVYPMLIEVYGGAPPNSTRVFIFHTYEELLNLGNPPPNLPRDSSCGGFTWYGKLSEEVGEHVELYNIRDGIKWLLAHEIGHRFFYYVYPNLRKPVRPDWLDEGLAVCAGINASQNMAVFTFQPIVDSVKTGNPPLVGIAELDGLLASSDKRLVDLFYAEAGTIIHYVSKRYGEEILHRLLKEYDRSINLEDAIPRVLNISFNEFEREWMDLVKKTALQAKDGAEFFTLFDANARPSAITTTETTTTTTPASTSTSIEEQVPTASFPWSLVIIGIVIVGVVVGGVTLAKKGARSKSAQPAIPEAARTFFCSYCGRDLSQLPNDIENCPYCGKAVSTPSIEVKPAVKVELPANVQRIRKCAKRVALLGLLIASVSFILGPFLGGSMGSEHTYMFSVLHEYQNAIGNGVLVGVSIAIASAIVRTIAGSLVRSQIVEGGELVLRWILGIVMILLSVTSTFFGMPFLLDWYAVGLLIAICLLVPKKYSMKSSIILLALALVYALWPQPPQGGGLTFGPSLFEDISWLITSWLHAISTTTWGMSQIDFWALLCEKVLSIFAGALLITRKIWFQEKREVSNLVRKCCWKSQCRVLP